MKNILIALLLVSGVAYADVYEIVITVESTDSPVVSIENVTPTPDPEPEPDPDPTPDPEPEPDPDPEPTPDGLSWSQVSFSPSFSDVWTPLSGNYEGWGGLRAYTGGADGIYIAPGGHLDHKFNGVIRIADTGFEMVVPHLDHEGRVIDNGDKIPYKFTDDNGNARPLSAHLYSASVRIGDLVYSARYAPFNSDGGGHGHDWVFNLNTLEFTEIAKNPQGAAAIGVNIDGVLYRFGKTGLARYNVADDNWTNDDYTDHGWLEGSEHVYGTGAHHKASGWTVILSKNILDRWQVGNVNDAFQDHPVWSGDTEIVGASKSGLTYSDHMQAMYAYNPSVNPSAIYEIDPEALTITRHNVSGSVCNIKMDNYGIFTNFYAHENTLRLVCEDMSDVREIMF